MSTGSAVAWNMPNRLNFLTIVPMFHCNGWCYPWTIAMLNGRTICLRNIDVKKIFELIDKYNVTHFGGAPIILNMITGAPESDRKVLKQKVRSKPKTTRRKIRVTKRSKFGNTCTYSLPYFGMNVPSISKTTSGTNETGLTSTAWMWPAPPGSLNLDRQQGSWYKYKM